MDVDATSVSGTWFRHVPGGGDVLYQAPHPPDNRWQRGSIVDALNFGDQEETVWAEWYRALAERALPPQQGLPRDLWRWDISFSRAADLSDRARLARVGLPALRPTRRQWPAFQAIGEQLHEDGRPAIVCRSAARPEGLTLCVFRTARVVAGATPKPPPTPFEDPPVVPIGMRT